MGSKAPQPLPDGADHIPITNKILKEMRELMDTPHGYLNNPMFRTDLPETIADQVKIIEHKADELDSIKATLIVNCYPGRVLSDHGIKYDETKSVHSNLIHILEILTINVETAP